jgi:MFS transporter, DHA1 family, multidrug resistance protein
MSVAVHFDVSREVGVLGVSLYVLGFATGPIIWAPSSELYGRKSPLLISCFAFSIFSIAVAVAKDVQTVFISRFFSGIVQRRMGLNFAYSSTRLLWRMSFDLRRCRVR